MNISDLYFRTRNNFYTITEPLEIEDYVPQPVDFVSPPKWHLGHTSWFFEEFILAIFREDYQRFHPSFEFLFNSYYNEKGNRIARNLRGVLSRPTVREVWDYRNHVDEAMRELFAKEISPKCEELIILGIHHEMQHQELFFTDLKYTFHLNPTQPVYSNACYVEDISLSDQNWIEIEEGLYSVGNESNGFSFDNENPSHRIHLPRYAISDRLTSNAEYLEFIEDGGYQNYEYWHEEGWSWVRENKIQEPMYWKKMDNQYYQYTLAGLKPVQGDHPITHINYYEAFAFAEWKSCRLPTEYEWEVASSRFSWGHRWEWTASSYTPYPGFRKNKDAGEYNGKFMVNQQVLRGSSVVTPDGHARKTYRNFFHPHIGYQFNGIRLARDV